MNRKVLSAYIFVVLAFSAQLWYSKMDNNQKDTLKINPKNQVKDILGGILDGKKNITIRGAGIEKTVLSFLGQKEGAEGIRVSGCENIVFEDFTIEDHQ